LFVNFFQPSFKLAAKKREGAKVAKRYHPPQTPGERLLMAAGVPIAAEEKLRELSLDPRSAAAAGRNAGGASVSRGARWW
jgi:hypothetical protein